MLLQERILPSIDKCDNLYRDHCEECKLTHWSFNPKSEPINVKSIFNLSLNIKLCDTHKLSCDCYKNDVLIKLDDEYKNFAREDYIGDDLNEAISYTYIDANIVFFDLKKINEIKGNYPFPFGGEKFEFKVYAIYRPVRSNLFHFELHVYGNHENGELKRIQGKVSSKPTSQKYRCIIANDIKTIIIGEELFTYE